MSVPHLFHVIRQLHGNLTVIIKFAPGNLFPVFIHLYGLADPRTEMHLIDGHGLIFFIFFCPVLHPHIISPLITADIPDNRCIGRTQLSVIAIGVRLQHGITILCFYLIFINGAHIQPWNKQFKYSRISQFSHLVAPSIPHVKITHNADTHSTGSPYCKIYSLHALYLHCMRAHLLIDIIINARFKLFQFLFLKLRPICIGVLNLLCGAVVIGDDQCIFRHGFPRNQHCKETRIIHKAHRVFFFAV